MKHKIKMVPFFIAILTAVSLIAVSCADSADTRSEGENANIADANIADADIADTTSEDESMDDKDAVNDNASDVADNVSLVDDDTETENDVYDLETHIFASHDVLFAIDDYAPLGFNDAVSLDCLLMSFGFDFSSSDYIVNVEGTGNGFDGGFYESVAVGDEIGLSEIGTSYETAGDNLGSVYWSMPEDIVTVMLYAADSGQNVDSLIITASENGNIVKAAYINIYFECEHYDGFMEGYNFYAAAYDYVTFPKTESGEYQNVTMDYVRNIFSSDE
ncbi:MAG: hypothetical protein LUE25_04810 [Clostridiales bacterium]|nr:hypothetical protein [Clostridiales bacterium]